MPIFLSKMVLLRVKKNNLQLDRFREIASLVKETSATTKKTMEALLSKI
jgi:hypothetical protein